MHELFFKIHKSPLYIEAQEYRTAAAHGTSAAEVSNTVKIQRDVVTEVPQVVDGKLLKKNVKAKAVVSVGVGEYTNVRTIMENIEGFSEFSGSKSQEAIKLMTQQSHL